MLISNPSLYASLRPQAGLISIGLTMAQTIT